MIIWSRKEIHLSSREPQTKSAETTVTLPKDVTSIKYIHATVPDSAFPGCCTATFYVDGAVIRSYTKTTHERDIPFLIRKGTHTFKVEASKKAEPRHAWFYFDLELPEPPPPPPPKYTLTISATTGGTTEPAPGSYRHPAGTVVKVTALPDPNYKFDHWQLDGVPRTENPIDVLMDADHTLHAVFVYVPPPPVTATLQGTVSDSKTGVPVEGVSVACDGYAAVTDVNGFYRIAEIPAQVYTVTASKLGYLTTTMPDVDLSAGGTFTLNISLVPMPAWPELVGSAVAASAPVLAVVGVVAAQEIAKLQR